MKGPRITPESTSEGVAKHTTIRIIDPNHIVVSDDSHPDVPVWIINLKRGEA